MEILIPALWFALLGGVFGIILAIASKVFAVKVDERVSSINEILPGANCGGCGYAGCSAYAEAVIRGEAPIGACNAGGNAVAQKMAEIMGEVAENVVEMRAFVLCHGEGGTMKYIYEGAPDCVSAARLGGGSRQCQYGCIGLGSCASVCDCDAIEIKGGVAHILPEKCIGCGKCVNICPKNLIKLLPESTVCYVGCNSADKGSAVRSYCKAGCIGCKMCEKVCEVGAIKADGALAVIDQSICIGCKRCAEKCPRKIIKVTKNGICKIEE